MKVNFKVKMKVTIEFFVEIYFRNDLQFFEKYFHKTSRPRKPQLHARAPAFPANAIKLRDTCGAQLYSVVVIEVATQKTLETVTIHVS